MNIYRQNREAILQRKVTSLNVPDVAGQNYPHTPDHVRTSVEADSSINQIWGKIALIK